MDNPNANTFLGAYLKVRRAQYHINSLITYTQPLDPGLYGLEWLPAIGRPCAISLADFGPDLNPEIVELTFWPKQPIGEILALTMGDAIHNLRSSLDYAATAVCRAAGKDTKFVTFPFHKERTDLIPDQCAGLKQIQAAFPNADVTRFFQDTIKPYLGGKSDLWTLTKVDKIDKHNFIVPTVTIARVTNANTLQFSGLILSDIIAGRETNEPFAIYRVPAKDAAANNNDFKVSVDISFPKGEHFSERPVIQTLLQTAELVVETLNAFETFAIENGIDVSIK